jgi:long-chain fatty acid transport protein
MTHTLCRHYLYIILWLWMPTCVLAGNGLNDSATGFQSAGLANADLALTNNTFALNINPAGLSHINGSTLDIMVEGVLWDVEHHDSIGGTTKLENNTAFVYGGGYARRLNPEWVAGIGLFFQGGAGFEYKQLPNTFGSPDDINALFGSLKIIPGFSWQANKQLTLGVSVALIYSTAEQELFSNTSTATFQGFRIEDLSGVSSNFRIGLLYVFSPKWSLAANYTSEAPIRLKGGTMRINRSASSQPTLTYKNVTIDGLNFAEEFSLGLAYKATDRWTLAVDLTWAEWSSAMKSSVLTAKNPDDPAAKQVLAIETPQEWRDHLLAAIGTEFWWSNDTLLRAGISYGRSPQQETGLNPANNLIPEFTIGMGVKRRLNEKWDANASMVWQPKEEQTYVDPTFGDNAKETFGAYAWYFGLTRRWK